MSELHIEIIPCLKDNYAYLLRTESLVAVIDPSETAPIVAALKGDGLTHILNTHHHWDHSGANRELKEKYHARVIGPEKDHTRIPAIDEGVDEEHGWQFGDYKVDILDVPGHTRGAAAYVIDGAVFSGDTLFALGCGKIFEGTPEMMVQSLAKFAALPDDTKLYCGHEYTLTNAHFALTLEPGNAALQKRVTEVKTMRAKAEPTVPSTIGLEKATNPFLRTQSEEIRTSVGMLHASAVEVFAEIRRRKDHF